MSDMPRYIDADKLLEEVKCGGHALQEWSTLGVCCVIERQPIADVIPKSEYDRLEKLYDDMIQEAKGYLKRLYGIRADVAQEIFEEIEEYVIKGISVGGEHLTLFNGKNFAELKKKYIGGNDNGKIH